MQNRSVCRIKLAGASGRNRVYAFDYLLMRAWYANAMLTAKEPFPVECTIATAKKRVAGRRRDVRLAENNFLRWLMRPSVPSDMVSSRSGVFVEQPQRNKSVH